MLRLVCDTAALRFRGSKREIPFGGNLTPALSLREREKRCPAPEKAVTQHAFEN